MCFSATASFVTAGLTGAIGIVCLTKASNARQLPLAATPILFALQQTIEGLLWLNLLWEPGGLDSAALTSSYLFFAEVFWPIYSPLAVFLIEPSIGRRHFMLFCLAVGVSLGTYLLWPILTQTHNAAIQDGHIVYAAEHRRLDVVALSYLTATSLPLVLSSHRTMVVLGAITLVGSMVAYVSYWEAFVSVWCFFAAAASVAILHHFDWTRRRLIVDA